jgi:hypothetical protein
MNRITWYKTLLIFLAGIAFAFASYSQKILILENMKTLKNIKYYQGSDIKFSLKTVDLRISDQILDMTDTSLILANYGELKFSEIGSIIREQWFINVLSGFSMLAGVAYFGIDSFNRLINEEWPMVDSQTLAISTGLVAFGFMLIPFRYKKIHIGEPWKLRVIDPGAL